MATITKSKENNPISQLVVQLPVAEKNFLKDAADAEGYLSLSEFVRSVMLKEAQTILGRVPLHPTGQLSSDGFERQAVIYAYIGNTPPAGAMRPAIAFPSIRSFATAFSDPRRAMLRYLAHNTPESIQTLAHTFGQAPESMTRTLAVLAGYGVVAYQCGGGKQLIPHLACDRVKLVVLFSPSNCGGAELRCAVRSERAEVVPPHDRLYTSINELASALPPSAYRVLLVIAEHTPDSVRQIARHLGVNPDPIYKSLETLERMRLIETVGGYGRKPVLACDGLSLELVFRENPPG